MSRPVPVVRFLSLNSNAKKNRELADFVFYADNVTGYSVQEVRVKLWHKLNNENGYLATVKNWNGKTVGYHGKLPNEYKKLICRMVAWSITQ